MTEDVVVKELSFSERLAYENSQFAKNWLTQEYVNSSGVMVRLAYMHMVGGNAYDALVLSQIMYWHGNNAETGKPRMSFVYQGNLWIVKSYEQWAEETGINSHKTIRNCFERLEKLGLIVKVCHRSPMHGQGVTSYVRIDWTGFQVAINKWIQSEEAVSPSQGQTENPSQGQTENPSQGQTLESPYEGETFPDTTPENTNQLVAESATDGADGASSSDKGERLALKDQYQAVTQEDTASKTSGDDEVTSTPMPALVEYIEAQDTFQAKLDKKQLDKLTTDRKFRDDSGEMEYKYLSPSKLYERNPLFKEYVADMIATTKRINNGLLPFKTMVGMIANYDRKTAGIEGWIIWEKLHAKAVTVEAESSEMTPEELERQLSEAAVNYYD